MSMTSVIVPLVTAFTDDSMSVSEVRMGRLVAWHRDHGAAGFLVASEAGEVFALSHSERKQLVEWTVRDARGLPVFVNVSSSTTAAVLDLAQHAERHGAYAGVLTTPLLIGLTPDEESSFVTTVHRYANLTCSVLNMPGGAPEGADRALHALHGSEHEPFAVSERPSSEEFFGVNGVCTSIGVLGAHKTKKLETGQPELLSLTQAILRKYRSHRVGKAWLANAGMEIGPLRSPLHSLNGHGAEAVNKLASVL